MAKTVFSIGLDLSYSGTGVVILYGNNVAAYEFKAGKPKMLTDERILNLWAQLEHVLPTDKPNCNIVIEGAAYAAEFNAFMLGELNGGLKVLLNLHGYKYKTVSPGTLKKYATGSGTAQKTFVAACVAQKWNFVHASNNVTDAYVLAKIAEEGVESVGEKLNKHKSKSKKSPK